MDAVFRLADGRALGYVTYGDPEGAPIFLLHGTPGSRLWFENDDPVASEMGLRLIACDRPGYGLSDPRTARSFVDFSADLRQLATGLGVDRFRILSVSGGGPFALACAGRLGPERVDRVALVSSPSPRGPDWDRGMARANRVGFRLARFMRHGRWLGSLLLKPLARFTCEHPDAYFRRLARELCPSDREISRRPEFRRQLHRELVEAYRRGVEGLMEESILLSQPWGFALAEVETPVDIWHGTEDTLAPLAMASALHGRLPNSLFHPVSGRGHFLIEESELWREILRGLR